jgi:hypothetical protein
MKSNNLKVGDWSKKKNRWSLRINETYLLVGTAISSPDSTEPNRMEVYAFFHDPYNTMNEYKVINTTDDPKKIHTAWTKCMDKLLSKMFT